MNTKKVLFGLIGVVIIVTALVVTLSGGSSGVRSFSATLSGANEVPPVATAATGMATFQLAADGMSMTFTLSVSNIIDVTAAHIHLAMPGVNGPVVVPLSGPHPGPLTGVLAQGTITSANLGGLLAGMTMADLVAQIDAGNSYVNVHTTVNPGGAIRGPIITAP